MSDERIERVREWVRTVAFSHERPGLVADLDSLEQELAEANGEVMTLTEIEIGLRTQLQETRAEVGALSEVNEVQARMLTETRAEVERLRAALNRIAAGNVVRDLYTERRKAIARQALLGESQSE
jgi:predicted  nucleic acid-binding Zn-ribbon protein